MVERIAPMYNNGTITDPVELVLMGIGSSFILIITFSLTGFVLSKLIKFTLGKVG